jgi:hypothetical protein
MPKQKKKSLSGDNWLRAFYQLCGLEPERAEIAIAMRYEPSTASVNWAKRAIRQKAKRTAIFAKRREPSL